MRPGSEGTGRIVQNVSVRGTFVCVAPAHCAVVVPYTCAGKR